MRVSFCFELPARLGDQLGAHSTNESPVEVERERPRGERLMCAGVELPNDDYFRSLKRGAVRLAASFPQLITG